MTSQADVVRTLAGLIVDHRGGTPFRIGIDGASAAGKTMLADAIAAELGSRCVPVLRASIDDFHLPGHRDRSRQTGWAPEVYFEIAFDYASFRSEMLEPLGPGGTRRVRTGTFDSLHDDPLNTPAVTVPEDVVAIIDGVFLLRPEFADQWDYLVWLDIDEATIRQRAAIRDVAGVGSADEVRRRYDDRWLPLHRLYEKRYRPREVADVIIDNRAVENPVIVRLK